MGLAVAIHDSTDFATPYRSASTHPLGGKTKRAFDVVASIGAIIVLAPLLALISLLILVLDGGPVMIRHTRVGCGGAKFSCFKFRTMVTNGDEVLRAHLATDASAL